jgi:two-component system alkaline phosphatase synthesis response regulator PhoP
MGGMKPHVLIVDDDEDILELLQYNLEKEGFKVKALAKSREALRVAREFDPDLIILDIMMDHPNGIELCRELRSLNRFVNTYIFFLTAVSEDYFQNAALNTGGDDFIDKMMGLRSLTFKVNSVLKHRFVIRRGISDLQVGEVALHRKSGAVNVRGRDILLNKHEFELLFFFAQNSGRLVSCNNLLRLVWGTDQGIVESTAEQYIDGVNDKVGITLIEKIQGYQFRFTGRKR